MKTIQSKKDSFLSRISPNKFFFIYFASKQKIEKSQYSDKTASASSGASFFRMVSNRSERESRVTGDEEQGTMESVKKGGEVPSRSCAVFLVRRYF